MIEDAVAAEDGADGTEGSDREPVLRGRGVVLTPVELDDAELLHRWRSDPVTSHEYGIWPRPLSALRDRINTDMADHERDDFLVLLPDGTPIGHISLVDQDMIDGTAEVNLMLDADHRGLGHGSDALDALVDLAFGELPMHRVQAVTHTTNTAAISVLTKSGFTHEGVRRSWCVHRGRRHDVAVLALLRPEWESLTRPRSWDL
jgi:RimJ/RimL family protein N-acetyltransferase